jgi:hypothetical protein
MTSTLAVTRIHLERRYLTFVSPLTTIVGAALLSVLVYVVLMRVGTTSTEGYDPRNNPAMVWALPWVFGYLGVSMVSTSFPFGLAVGATRRAYAGGTLLAYVAMSGYATVVMTALLALERATGHWFASMYIFDSYLLGSGDLLRCALITFLGSLTIFALCSTFAAAWIRFRGRGPLGIAAAIVLAAGVALIVTGDRLGSLFAGFHLWWLAIAACLIIAVALGGTYLFLRRASVR